MSFNDRCGEAWGILRAGGTIPNTPEVREALLEMLERGIEGSGFVPRDLVDQIKTHPENQELAEQTRDSWAEDFYADEFRG